MSKPVIVRGEENKCKVVKMHLKLRDQQLKTITYTYIHMHTHVHILLYRNLMVTTNQKSIIDTHTKKRKESKHNIKDSHQITREDKKKEQKRTTKATPKQLTKWQREHILNISIISSNVNGLNAPIKRQSG